MIDLPSRPEEAYATILALRKLGIPNRMLADLLGVHESTTSRSFRDPRKTARFFRKRPEALDTLREIAENAEEYLRRWLLSKRVLFLMERYSLLTHEEAQELALEELRRERPDLFASDGA